MLVKIKQGILEGKTDVSVTTGKVFYSFLGIPYAEPPIEKLRFKPPIPAASWGGIRDATYDRSHCFKLAIPQPKERSPQNESEDCLYINVFTPKSLDETTPLKPVMVHIHGGGYFFGDGNMDSASPDHLMDYDVVFVSFNFRLHIFGFLNLNTPSSTGNCGCKDQVLALKWVRENIQFFGGDPENVTIFGESTGANSVHLLTISPLATGLFHKAIVESGTIIAPWIHEDQVEAGFKIGRKLGFTGTDAEELVEFLTMQKAETLAKATRDLLVNHKSLMPAAVNSPIIFGPSIDKFSDTAFLPDYPVNLLSTSQPIPMIAGVAEKEGVCVLFGQENIEGLFTLLQQDLTHLVKSNVPCDSSKIAEISEMVRNYYFGPLENKATDEEIRDKLVEIYSHLLFRSFYDIIEKTTKERAPLYVYRFEYLGDLNESLHWGMNIEGCLHADESEYITLSRSLHPSNVLHLSETDRKVVDNLCTAWTNFARTSNPNPLPGNNDTWTRYAADKPSFMLFTDNCTMKKGKIWEEGLKFWKRIFCQYVDNKNQKFIL